jgi:chemotaxis protein CheD
MTVRPYSRERRLTERSDPADFGSGVYRYHDARFDTVAVKVFPGEHYVTDAEEMLVTVLGACVCACIRDPVAGVGGMNHFTLPEADDGEPVGGAGSPALRYANAAMGRLIDGIVLRGGSRERLEIQVFGGGNVPRGGAGIGHRNATFIEAYLAAGKLPIAAADLRGELPRRVHFFAVTGKVVLLQLRRAEDAAVAAREARYLSKLRADPVARLG